MPARLRKLRICRAAAEHEFACPRTARDTPPPTPIPCTQTRVCPGYADTDGTRQRMRIQRCFHGGRARETDKRGRAGEGM